MTIGTPKLKAIDVNEFAESMKASAGAEERRYWWREGRYIVIPRNWEIIH